MKNSIHELLSTVAENNNLTVVETTSERDGYPSNTSFSIIGFESPEQFRKVEQELNELLCLHKETECNEDDEFLTVNSQDLHRRDGWNFWHREGHAVDDAYDMKECYENMDRFIIYSYGECSDEEDFINSEFTPFLDECETFDAIREHLDSTEKMWHTIDSLEEGQIAVRDTSCYDDDFEVMDRYVMAYSYDTHNYTKALSIE